MAELCPSLNLDVEVLQPPIPQNVTLVGHRVLREVIQLK